MWNRRKCIYFCTKIEEISFPEAVAKVAQMIGYPLEISTNGFEPKPNVNQPYYDVMNDYIAYTQYELNAATGMACLEYCHRRNINEDIIKRFQIGYAPAQEKSYHYLKAKKYSDEILLDTGLIREGNDGYTSTFFDRLMIPIHDENGNPVGFTARIITNKEGAPKYINTSQTKIYEKSNLVFNYHERKILLVKNIVVSWLREPWMSLPWKKPISMKVLLVWEQPVRQIRSIY